MDKQQWMYTAIGAIILLGYVYMKHSKLVKDLKADDNKTALAASSAAVKKDLGLS